MSKTVKRLEFYSMCKLMSKPIVVSWKLAGDKTLLGQRQRTLRCLQQWQISPVITTVMSFSISDFHPGKLHLVLTPPEMQV